MEALAKRIEAARPNEISFKPVRWERFPNGQPNLFIGGFEGGIDKLRRSSVSVLVGFTDQSTFFAQFSLLHELTRLDPGWLQILMPYHSSATSERANLEGEVPNAEAFSTMLCSVVRPGPHRLVMYDLHALAVKGFLEPSLRMIPRTATTMLKQAVVDLGLNEDDVVYVFPDDGAHKRFRPMFDGALGGRPYRMGVCGKVRDGERRNVTLREGTVSGLDAIIVDDMIRSGGTMLECAKALTAAGARKVYIFGTHADFEPGAAERFIRSEGIERVWVTDSCPEAAYAVDGKGPFRVLSLDRKLAEDVCDDAGYTK